MMNRRGKLVGFGWIGLVIEDPGVCWSCTLRSIGKHGRMVGSGPGWFHRMHGPVEMRYGVRYWKSKKRKERNVVVRL